MFEMRTEVNGYSFKNPLLIASGCFGFAEEAQAWMDLSILGGFCSKGLTLKPRQGNPPPRIAEVSAGMLNSVGLQNPGLTAFIEHDLERLLALDCRLIVNVAGHCLEDYLACLEQLEETKAEIIELNLSCPNVKTGCMSLGSHPELIYETVAACRKISSKTLWIKLTPNTTSIADCARAAEAAGADAVSLINTLLGMAVDLKSRRPILRNNTGGLSGPCVKPIALRMLADCYKAVKIPLIGLGGVSNGRDFLEFILCGAKLVQIGTILLKDPAAASRILAEATALAEDLGVHSVDELYGQLEPWS